MNGGVVCWEEEGWERSRFRNIKNFGDIKYDLLFKREVRVGDVI